MPKIKLLDIIIDLRSMNAMRGFLAKGGKPSKDNPIMLGMKQAADIYVDWLRNRYVRNSMSGGSPSWPDIEESTKDRKMRRGYDPDSILRETDTLMNSISARNTGRGGYFIGYHGGGGHPRYPGSVTSLAILFQETGISNGKRWSIIVQPSKAIKEDMIGTVDFMVRVAISESNKMNRRK